MTKGLRKQRGLDDIKENVVPLQEYVVVMCVERFGEKETHDKRFL